MATTAVLLGSGPVTLTGPPPTILRSPSSAVAGFLQPITAPLYDNPLDDFLHAFLVGLSAIPGQLVRPRWQPEPPNLPSFSTDWLSWGITEIEEDRFAFQDQRDSQSAIVERDEMLTMLMSFYGPSAGKLAKQVSAGIQLSQNRAYLRSQSMTVIEVFDQVRIPSLLKEKWVPRVDLRARFRRRATWAYPIQTIESVQAALDNDQYLTLMVVTDPPSA